MNGVIWALFPAHGSQGWTQQCESRKGEETVIRREGEAEGGLKESIFRLGKIRCLRPVEKGSRAVGIVTRSSTVTLTLRDPQ